MSKQPEEEENRALKNAIFAAKEAARQSSPNNSLLSTEVAVASVPLPSKGLVYPPDSPLYNQALIDIKAMTAREEDILMSRALIRKGTVITELIKSCLLDKTIDVNSMLSGDRNALMVAIRITGYGSEYSPRVTCPGCEQQQDFTFDLSALPIRELDLDILKQVKEGTNEFEFSLPVSKRSVVFKFLTGKEEESILSTIEAKKKKGFANDNVVTTRLLHAIVSVDNVTDRSEITKFVSNMPARDSMLLRQHIDNNEPSVDMSQEFACNGCGYQEVISVPIDASFLWSRSRR